MSTHVTINHAYFGSSIAVSRVASYGFQISDFDKSDISNNMQDDILSKQFIKRLRNGDKFRIIETMDGQFHCIRNNYEELKKQLTE